MSKDRNSRKNVMHISDTERDNLRDAFIALNLKEEFRFPGNRNDKPFAGGVSYWFKQDEIHQATHVHGGPAFLTWHRELCNRFERLLRLADKKTSLHYWDWNEDPNDIFNSEFMGMSHGEAGEPWLSAGFYNPYPVNDQYRGVDASDIDHINPADPPLTLTREKKKGTLQEYMTKEEGVRFFTDAEIVESENYSQMRLRLEHVHNYAHNYIGGTIGDPHTSFRDPFVFLIHSNVDRLFAAWQLRKGKEFKNRLDPEEVYGYEKNTVAKGSTSPYVIVGIRTMLSPWCGIGYPYYHPKKNSIIKEREEPGVNDVRPWTYPENWHRDPKMPHEKPKNSLDRSIVIPQAYDKFPDGFEYKYDIVEST
ncbi:MAG TPA: tyrosinase family protein [Nitrososphaeraceae archaeon]|nr:tyrosinase family protein [Nitrososphaeraceae archaeon]